MIKDTVLLCFGISLAPKYLSPIKDVQPDEMMSAKGCQDTLLLNQIFVT